MQDRIVLLQRHCLTLSGGFAMLNPVHHDNQSKTLLLGSDGDPAHDVGILFVFENSDSSRI
jgi:hypothetical protein